MNPSQKKIRIGRKLVLCRVLKVGEIKRKSDYVVVGWRPPFPTTEAGEPVAMLDRGCFYRPIKLPLRTPKAGKGKAVIKPVKAWAAMKDGKILVHEIHALRKNAFNASSMYGDGTVEKVSIKIIPIGARK